MEKRNICLFLNDRYHFLFSLPARWNGIFHVSVGFIWERACRKCQTHIRHIWNRPIRFFHYKWSGSVTLPVTARGNTELWHTKMHLTKASQEDRNAFSIILCMSLKKKMLLSSSTSTQYHTFHKLALASCLGFNKTLDIFSFFPKGYSS